MYSIGKHSFPQSYINYIYSIYDISAISVMYKTVQARYYINKRNDISRIDVDVKYHLNDICNKDI